MDEAIHTTGPAHVLRPQLEEAEFPSLSSNSAIEKKSGTSFLEREREREMGEEERKRRVVVESLGWLTESSIMPKKHRAIEGVGASSIMELKAHLYKSQEESKKTKDPDALSFHRAKPTKISDSFSVKNSGVEARAHKYPSLLSRLSLLPFYN
jgi:hypothetical protein